MAGFSSSGLSIDSDPFSSFSFPPTVLNSFQHFPVNHSMTTQYHHQSRLATNPDHHNKGSMHVDDPIFHSRLDHEDHDHLRQHPERRVIDEMDFFADDHKKRVQADSTGCYDRQNTTEGPDHESTHCNNVNTVLHLLTANTCPPTSDHHHDSKAKNEVVMLQAKIKKMNRENQMLKEMIDQVNKRYSAMQAQLKMMSREHQQEDQLIKNNQSIGSQSIKAVVGSSQLIQMQFMDLGLAPALYQDDNQRSPSSSDQNGQEKRSRSPQTDLEVVSKIQTNRGEAIQGPPNKVPRFNPSKSNVEQASTEATMRKARVSVRARLEAPMMTDGCQWRKYGQKTAKGNPCPRAYYRCTMAVGCPVRKQVQRCAEDMTILITTYEGNHNHMLPPAAMAMASETSSAARMLLSGSMSSADGLMNPNFIARTILPCSSSSNIATISASAPFPTVTLDLTQNPNATQQIQPPVAAALSQIQSQLQNPSQNLSFLPHIFTQALYNQSKFSGLQMSQDADNSLGPKLQLPQGSLADSVTAAMAADPNFFTNAVAAAISSIIGNSHPNNNNNNNNKDRTSSGENIVTSHEN